MAGAQCCENPPALNPTSGEGSVVESFGGLKAYINGPSHSNLSILLSLMFSLADKVAAAGFFVVVPDFFYGDPYNPEIPISAWFPSHGTEKGFEDAKQVIAALKAKGVTAIGAAGFCWGGKLSLAWGKVVAELAKSNDLKAAVMLHPSLVTVDDIKETKTHLAVLGAEIDKISPPELLKQFEPILSANSEQTFRKNKEEEKVLKELKMKAQKGALGGAGLKKLLARYNFGVHFVLKQDNA